MRHDNMDCWRTLHDDSQLYFYFDFNTVTFVQHGMVETNFDYYEVVVKLRRT